MKTLNTQWKLIALGTFVVIGTLCAGRVMSANTYIRALGPIGLTRGQTLRVGLVVVPGPHVVFGVTVFDCGGNTLMSNTYDPDTSNTCSSFDLNADQLPQQLFDNAGRTEMNVRLTSGGGIWKPGSFFATLQVFDNATGKTTEMLTFTPGDGN